MVTTAVQSVQVSCINKRDRTNTHESISHLGGYHNGKQWKLSSQEVIVELESARPRWSFYTDDGRKRARVEVVYGSNARKWLQTRADGVLTNNLLYLAECV